MTAFIKVIGANKPFFSQAAVFLSLATNKGFKLDPWNAIFNPFVRQYFSFERCRRAWRSVRDLHIHTGIFTLKKGLTPFKMFT